MNDTEKISDAINLINYLSKTYGLWNVGVNRKYVFVADLA